jgi:hypothetical protein
MKKISIVLTVWVLMAALATPAMAFGPDQAATVTTTATITATATVAPTFTPQATYTPFPTFTPLPTYTPLPTFTPLPQPTSAPVAQPTAVPEEKPTLAPTPESPSGFEVGGGQGKLVFGGSYTLRSGERLSGDLVVFGGNAQLETDTRVDGNIVVIGGEADIAGRVRGDMVIVGGGVRLRSTAEVDGQLVRVGGMLQKDEGAQIHGGESGGANIPPIPPIPTRPPVEYWPLIGVNTFFNFVVNVMYDLGVTVALALLAALVVVLWHEPVERVSQTIVNAPAASWGVGALTVLAFVVVLPAFAVLSAILIIACGLGLLGFGVIAAASVALVVGWLMGWIALGQFVGQRLLDMLGNRHPTPAASAAVGTAVLTLFWLGLAPLCGMGWLIFAVLSPLGLGAVVLTRFGSQDYRTSNGTYPSAWSPAPAPVAPTAPVAPVAPAAPVAPEPPQFTPVTPSEPDATPSSESPASSDVTPSDKPAGES